MKTKLFITVMMVATTAATTLANAQDAQDTRDTQTIGQNCRCEDDFNWMKSTFETNDAGFGYIVERKGRAAYDLHNSMTLEKVKAAQNSQECREAMAGWLSFFRRGHIGLQLLIPDPVPATQNAAQTSKPEMWKGDVATFEKEVATLTEAQYEGIWEHIGGYYSVGIKAENGGYTCFIVMSKLPFFKPGQLSARISPIGDAWQTTYYDYNNGAVAEVADGKPELFSNALMILGGEKLARVSPSLHADPQIESYVKSITTRSPYIEVLNHSTLYMRIPSFDNSQKVAIDKIVADNFDKLTSTENLIIDVRGNGGGSNVSYYELLPLIYTGPVRTPNMSFLATPLNIQGWSAIAAIDDLDETLREEISPMVEKMRVHQGELVTLYDGEIEIETRDTVYEYPNNVGIIIDGDCGSSTEQFLLAAKQSRKVKLFGTTTFGTLDASNVLTVDSPDGRFRLRYATSIIDRKDGMAIDDIGIQPDYYMDATIPDSEWVKFVRATF